MCKQCFRLILETRRSLLAVFIVIGPFLLTGCGASNLPKQSDLKSIPGSACKPTPVSPELLTFEDVTAPIALSSEEIILAVAAKSGAIELFDLNSGKKVLVMAPGQGKLTSLALSHDSRYLASAHSNNRVLGWELSSGKLIRELNGTDNYFEIVRFNREKAVVIGGSADHSIRSWELEKGISLKSLNLRGVVQAISSTTPLVAVQPSFNRISILDWTENREIASVSWERGGIGEGNRRDRIASEFSPNGKMLCGGLLDGRIVLWNVATGRQVALTKVHEGPIRSVAFSPDGRMIASCSEDGTVQLSETASGKQLAKLERLDGIAVALSQRLLVVATKLRVEVWGLPNVFKPGEMALQQAWQALSSRDPHSAHCAVWLMVGKANEAVDALRDNLRPGREEDIKSLVGELNSNDIENRDQAMANLQALGSEVLPVLQVALSHTTSGELRTRIESVISSYTETTVRSVGLLRRFRAILVLELIDSNPSREILRRIIKDLPGTREADEAQTALERMLSR